MKKRHIIVLGILLFALTISCATAADNGTDVIKEQSDYPVSIEKENITLSSDTDEPVAMIIENSSSDSSGDCRVFLADVNMTAVGTISSDSVLSACVNVTPLGSSAYKTPTKQQRTFNIAGFKAVLSQSQYKKLYKASSVEDEFFDYGYNDYYFVGEKFRGYGICTTGLWYSVTVKTNKYIKVKVKIGNEYKIKKTRAWMQFTYGAGQSGIAYRYVMTLTHQYANPGYDYSKVLGSNAKYFSKCKHGKVLSKLNKAKLSGTNYVYKKYSVY